MVDFGNGMRSAGDTQTPEKLAFIAEAAGIPVAGRSVSRSRLHGLDTLRAKNRGAAECVGVDVYQPALDVARALNDNWFRFAEIHFAAR